MPVVTMMSDTSGGAGFSDIRGLALDDNGHAVVDDAGEEHIEVFDSAGQLLYTFGRPGAGPGELRGSCCVNLRQTGHLWVQEGGNRRYSAFELGTSGARYLGSVGMPSGPTGMLDRVPLDATDRPTHFGIASLDERGAIQLTHYVLRDSSTWQLLDTLKSPSPESLGAVIVRNSGSGGEGVSVFQAPFSPRALWALGFNGGYASATSSAYDVRIVGEHGRLEKRIRHPAQAVALSDQERRRGERIISAIAQRRPDVAKRLELPESKPVLHAICMDIDRRLWVQLETAQGADGIADVYDGHGTWLFRVAWPGAIDLSLCAARGDAALGTTTDSLGLQHVVRLRLVPNTSGSGH